MRVQLKKVSLSGSMLALGAVALLAAGCAPINLLPQPTATPYYIPTCCAAFNGIMVTDGSSDVATLDPNLAADTNSLEVVRLIFDGLVTLDRNLHVELWGAKEIDVSADGLTYKFHLRPYQGFANAHFVLASDYAYGMNRALHPCLAAPRASNLFAIKDAQTFNAETCHNGQISAAQGQSGPVIQTLVGDSIVPDDSAGTLTVTLAHPVAYFLAALADSPAYALDPTVVGPDITSEAWLDHLQDGPTGQGTSGMFYLVRWDHRVGGQIVLKANPYWWGIAAGKKPNLTEIDWTLFKDGASAYAAYKAGQYDMAFVTPDQVARVQGRQDEHQVPLLAVSAVVMNWAMPPFDSLDARLAFCLAIDRDALVASLAPGAATPSWHIVPQGMPGYNPDLTGPDGVTSTHGDPDQARAHWQAYLQTLHGAPVPTITYFYPLYSASAKKWGEVLQQQWRAVLGVSVTLDTIDFVQPLQRALPNYQIQQFGWSADYPDPQDFLSNLFLPSSQYNTEHANVPAANVLMPAADANSDQEVRLQQYQQAEQLLVDQVAWCPISQAVDHYLLRSYVRNWFEGLQGVPPNDVWTQTFITGH